MPTQKRDPGPDPVYQLKITLKWSTPPIWRRLQVRGSSTLGALHFIIQTVMAWDGDHLHAFEVGDVEYGDPDPEWGSDMEDEDTVELRQILAAGRKRFRYVYDFGDNWVHDILVERVLPPDPDVRYPLLVTGKRAAPPDDVGGIWGYGRFLAAIADPAHEDHETFAEWVDEDFDPEALDVDAINRQLQAEWSQSPSL